MTYREFYTKVIDMGNEELATFAKGAIEQLDKRNASRKNGNSKTAKEAQELRSKIKDFMSTETRVYVASEIAKALDTTTQKITGHLTQMSKSGEVEVQDFTPTGKKKDMVKGYTLVVTEE